MENHNNEEVTMRSVFGKYPNLNTTEDAGESLGDLDTLEGVKSWMRSFFNGSDQPSADDLIERFEQVLRWVTTTPPVCSSRCCAATLPSRPTRWPRPMKQGSRLRKPSTRTAPPHLTREAQ